MGWSGVDGPGEYAWWKAQGIEFYTPLSPLGASAHYMYLFDPDHEVVEIWTQEHHHRFNHIHMLAADPKATAEWFALVTNDENPAVRSGPAGGFYTVPFGQVSLHIFPDLPALRPKERTGVMQPTDGTSIDHLAFSFRDVAAAYRRITRLGVPIVHPLSTDPEYGVKHFFIRAPNGVLVEMLQAKPLPAAAWE